MAKPSQSSFRRLLLSRILLLSIPVLLIGEALTYRKVRSSLLETARWNLTESAVKKGESITNEIAALKTNLVMASQTTVLQSGSPKQAQIFLEQLAPQLPPTLNACNLQIFRRVDLSLVPVATNPLTGKTLVLGLLSKREN